MLKNVKYHRMGIRYAPSSEGLIPTVLPIEDRSGRWVRRECFEDRQKCGARKERVELLSVARQWEREMEESGNPKGAQVMKDFAEFIADREKREVLRGVCKAEA